MKSRSSCWSLQGRFSLHLEEASKQQVTRRVFHSGEGALGEAAAPVSK